MVAARHRAEALDGEIFDLGPVNKCLEPGVLWDASTIGFSKYEVKSQAWTSMVSAARSTRWSEMICFTMRLPIISAVVGVLLYVLMRVASSI